MATTASKLWLKQHAASERKLAKALRRFLREQDKRILDLLGPQISTAALDLSFSADEEAELMFAEIEPLLTAYMATAAVGALRRSDASRKQQKAFNFSKFKLPKALTSAIETTMAAIGKAPYWRDIAANTKQSITDAIGTMIGEGLSIANMTKKLKTLLGGASEARAETIAVTETTGALNAGSQDGYDYLADEGVLAEKEWLAILDKRTRASHVIANGQRVAVKELFWVGGYQCPYPGWRGLPARERCRCRCTTVAVFE